MTGESITSRIRALLARTEERGATEAEAATAAAKAQELMLRYGIELAQIAEAQVDRLQTFDPRAAMAGVRADDGVDLELDARVRSGESTGLPRVTS
jgi:cobalamin biosynthesis protein CbiD